MRSILFLTVFISALPALHALDWPQFRGPNRDGISQEKGLLKHWPDNGPRRVWLPSNAGLGYFKLCVSRPAAVHDGSRNGSEQLNCLNAATGREQWATNIGPELINNWGGGKVAEGRFAK